MPTIEFYRRKNKSLTFFNELMDLLRNSPSFSEQGLKPHGQFMPSFKIKHREYCIVNKNDHVIIKAKYWYHEDGSHTVSPPPPKIFYSMQKAYKYLTRH